MKNFRKDTNNKDPFITGYSIDENVININYANRPDVSVPYSEPTEKSILHDMESQYHEGLKYRADFSRKFETGLEMLIGSFMVFVAFTSTAIFIKNPVVLSLLILSLLSTIYNFRKFLVYDRLLKDLDKYTLYEMNVSLLQDKVEHVDEEKMPSSIRKFVEDKRGKEININDLNDISDDDLLILLSQDNKPFTLTRTKEDK